LATAHLKALELLEPGTSLQLNLGTGQGCSVKEVIEACRTVTGHPIPTKIAPRRPGDPAELVADSSLARKVLDWQPQYTDIQQIVSTAWNWHRHHPYGYKD
jgi:UDP-glucose 4-epimerase